VPDATLRVYWGTRDGGTSPAAWAQVQDLGPRTRGPVAATLTGLQPRVTYFYRFQMANGAGTCVGGSDRAVSPSYVRRGRNSDREDDAMRNGVMEYWSDVRGQRHSITPSLHLSALVLLPILGTLLAGPILAAGTGLTGQYYSNTAFTALATTRVDTNVSFNWGTNVPAGTTLASANNFGVIWTGQIEPEFSELIHVLT
jgi:hypothetical protein